MKKIKWKTLIIAIAIPLLVGGLSALLTMGNMELFELVEKPPLSPPAWLFPVVWTALYVLMGISSYLVVESSADSDSKVSALVFYALQLVFNFFWSIFFFNLEAYSFSFIWLIALLTLIVITAVKFGRICEIAGLLFIPYIVWVIFAGYLNAGIALLN